MALELTKNLLHTFEPFFSGKGEEGRGLGLYIAKQLLERNDYSIGLAEIKSERILPGANFVYSCFGGKVDDNSITQLAESQLLLMTKSMKPGPILTT